MGSFGWTSLTSWKNLQKYFYVEITQKKWDGQTLSKMDNGKEVIVKAFHLKVIDQPN